MDDGLTMPDGKVKRPYSVSSFKCQYNRWTPPAELTLHSYGIEDGSSN
ncbi:hypothetical protein [Chryseobacterium indoltheticum]